MLDTYLRHDFMLVVKTSNFAGRVWYVVATCRDVIIQGKYSLQRHMVAGKAWK